MEDGWKKNANENLNTLVKQMRETFKNSQMKYYFISEVEYAMLAAKLTYRADF